jgi:hypothetical protein
MKNNKINLLLAVILFSVLNNSCIKNDDFNLPNISQIEPSVEANLTFQNVISRYEQAVANGESLAVFDNDQELYIEGYVISSDKAGNFFKELIIQNRIDGNSDGGDPRLGLRIELNKNSLYETFEIGRKIYIKLNGLAVGITNGVFAIGKQVGNSIGQIQEFEFQDFIIRDPEVAEIVPKISTIDELTEQDENTLIQLDNMQIHRNDLMLSFAGEPSDIFDGFRTLESCEDNNSLFLQTSTFADFKSLHVPQDKGSIKGIFSRDFKDDINVLIINSTLDIDFNTTERCDPIVLECNGSTAESITIFNEDFQSINNESDLDGQGWTNINVSGGSERFEDSSFGGDIYMKISAFGTGESPLEAWLITPSINLDSTSQEALSFEISSNFASGQILNVFITENFTGDPSTTEWIQLDANIPIGGSGFGDFISSVINISCLTGNVNVAFYYRGAAGTSETRYHIDDIKVTGSN